jgi:membrane protease YdiL (CAAX protease family)
MSYTRFQPMIRNAARRPQLWRLIAGMITVFVIATAMTAGIFVLATQTLGMPLLDPLDGGTAIETLLFLSTIAFGFGGGTWLAAWLWQGRSLGDLIGRGARTIRDFARAAMTTFVIAAIAWLVLMPFSEPLTPNLPFTEWLKWLPLALLLIFLQTGAEELLFRGYLQSQLAARFKSTWVWLLVPSFLFGLLHFLPGETIGPGLLYVSSTTLFGVIAADLTARTGNIGAAWGLHFANNCIAILVIVYLGAASGLGLYSAGTIEDALSLSPLLLLDVGVLVLLWLVIRRMVTL